MVFIRLAVLFLLFNPCLVAAQGPTRLNQEIARITGRPEFAHATFGIKIVDLPTRKVWFEENANKLFVPGSTAKLITEGTALALLGPDYRFHTRVYRTGGVAADGTLEGDLVLVAGGDLNLSARALADDTLAFTNADHSYAGSLPADALPGDPLVVLKKLARQVANAGIKKIGGSVRVDTSLFFADKPEPGSGAMISPIVVNDNVIDVTVTPGATEGGERLS